MTDIINEVENTDWQNITGTMHKNGYATVPILPSDKDREDFKLNYDSPTAYRRTVAMERYRFDLGKYKYFDYHSHNITQSIRTDIHPKLAPIANIWLKVLNIDRRLPLEHAELLQGEYETRSY